MLSHDGARGLEACQTAPSSQAEVLGLQVAEALLAQGAGELVRAVARDLKRLLRLPDGRSDDKKG